MRILVTGANGQVGRSMLDLHGQDGHEIIGLTREQFDLTKPERFDRIVAQVGPDAIVNAAAYTAVDKAEDEPELAHRINAVAPGIMASVAAKSRLPFIQISTDYVFDGQKRTPYQTFDKTNPINVYGKTKLTGEIQSLNYNHQTLVVRTSWVFSRYSANFVKTITQNLLASKKQLFVVDDQYGCPTSADSLARYIIKMIGGRKSASAKISHFRNDQSLNWFEFANLITKILADLSEASIKTDVKPISTLDYDRYKAARPLYSVLQIEKNLLDNCNSISLHQNLKQVLSELIN